MGKSFAGLIRFCSAAIHQFAFAVPDTRICRLHGQPPTPVHANPSHPLPPPPLAAVAARRQCQGPERFRILEHAMHENLRDAGILRFSFTTFGRSVPPCQRRSKRGKEVATRMIIAFAPFPLWLIGRLVKFAANPCGLQQSAASAFRWMPLLSSFEPGASIFELRAPLSRIVHLSTP